MQSVEIVVNEGDFKGMPFVLLSNGRWIKNNGSDFYIEFDSGPKKVKKVVRCLIFQSCSKT